MPFTTSISSSAQITLSSLTESFLRSCFSSSASSGGFSSGFLAMIPSTEPIGARIGGSTPGSCFSTIPFAAFSAFSFSAAWPYFVWAALMAAILSAGAFLFGDTSKPNQVSMNSNGTPGSGSSSSASIDIAFTLFSRAFFCLVAFCLASFSVFLLMTKDAGIRLYDSLLGAATGSSTGGGFPCCFAISASCFLKSASRDSFSSFSATISKVGGGNSSIPSAVDRTVR
mmetsp:Transcript_42384/g.76079  ORF Transcript_42384/g.76079 Transcript_42384/m.76079 type:complete len:227 (+) Transcript_42384:227-907(+)